MWPRSLRLQGGFRARGKREQRMQTFRLLHEHSGMLGKVMRGKIRRNFREKPKFPLFLAKIDFLNDKREFLFLVVTGLKH